MTRLIAIGLRRMLALIERHPVKLEMIFVMLLVVTLTILQRVHSVPGIVQHFRVRF